MPARILMITTSADTMGERDEPTGLWLEELTTPYYAFTDAGAEVTLSSIAGGAIPIDPRSLQAESEQEPSVARYFADPEFRARAQSTPAFESLNPADFDAVFLPGGHGTMFDYPENPALTQLISSFHQAGKAVGAVCHGPAGLVGATQADGSPLVAGRRVAAFTDSEERAAGLDQAVPFLLGSRLQELGAKLENGPDFAPCAVRDGHLVTGQNPASAKPAAELLLQVLNEHDAAA